MLNYLPPTGQASNKFGVTPRLSVVMPVRNTIRFVDEAIESVLVQTYSAFEFVIVDDGSTDGSWEKLLTWAGQDNRIRLTRSPLSPGPVPSSNHAVSLASADIVARMDSDDIAHPDRLERQLRVISEASDVVLVGSLWEAIDSGGRIVRPRDRSQMDIRRLRAPFCHGSIMFRRSAFDAAGGYRDECAFWEDTDLYFRMARLGRILVLPETLHRYRFSNSSTRLTSAADQVQRSVDLYFRCSDAIAAEGCYEPLLTAGRRRSGKKVTPRTFAALAALRIWEGRRPLLFWRAIRNSRAPRSLIELASFLYIAVGNVQPSLLRGALRLNVRRRDRRAAARFPDGAPHEWYWSRRQSNSKDRSEPEAFGRPARTLHEAAITPGCHDHTRGDRQSPMKGDRATLSS